MDLYFAVKMIHILSGAVLFGTGLGIAFFMVWANRARDPAAVAHVAGTVVVADALFTAVAVLVQPVSGLILIRLQGHALTEPWLVWAYGLYVLTGACWLPVVAIQMRLRDLARVAAAAGEPLPEPYHRLYRIWLALGFPAFGAVLGIYWLMIAKPG
ncbi:MAG TPA: DUF2269 domain-containing protein [Brevundimonas sp.]|jgi:uncharacterized membrane protein|uniref:DUF2269 family protein n=1 Tax=Brevundimonas sp. TaxID=1871086 RepID=UPI002DEDDEF1|nr:DUF2269 domain-containing protein [Brevundimonas sp.]